MTSSSYAQQQWQFHAQTLSSYGVEPQYESYPSYAQPQSQQEFAFAYPETSQHTSEHAAPGWPETQTQHFNVHDRGHGLRLDSLPISVAAASKSAYTSSPLDHQTMAWPVEYSSGLGYQTSEFGVSPGASRAYSPYSESSLSEELSTNYSQDSHNIFDMTFAQCLESGPSYSHMESDGSSSSRSSYSLSPPLPHQLPLLMQPLPSHPQQALACAPTSTTSAIKAPSSRTKTDANSHRRRFPCLTPGCVRRFTSQYTLKVHMEAHKPKPRVTFPCTMGCNERFSRQHDRLRHEVAKHAKVCEHSCGDCGRFFSTAKTLGNHKCPVASNGTRWVNT